MRSLPLILLYLFLLSLIGTSIEAATGGSPKALDSELSSEAVKMEPEEVPRYLLVLNFFLTANELYESAPITTYVGFLRQFGMEPGSAAEKVLSDVVNEHSLVLSRRTWDFSIQDKEQFERAQGREFAKKARDIARIYRDLLQRLTETDYDTQSLLQYIEESRHRVQWTASDRRTIDSMIMHSRAFTEELEGH